MELRKLKKGERYIVMRRLGGNTFRVEAVCIDNGRKRRQLLRHPPAAALRDDSGRVIYAEGRDIARREAA